MTKAKTKSVSLGYGRGRVDELPSGSWRWQGTIDGQRVSITRPTQPEAIAASEAAMRRLAKPDASQTIAEAAEGWRAIAVVGREGKTVQGYAWALDVIVGEIAALPVKSLTRAQLRGVLAQWTEHYGAGSIAKLRSVLGRVLEHAVDAGWTEGSVMVGLRTPGAPKRRRPAPKHLTPDDAAIVRRYLVHEHSTTHALALLMLLTGLRPGEARAVQWDAVDLDERRLYVCRSIRADADDVDHLVGDVKTSRYGDEGKRTIPLPPDLVAVLRRERAEQHARGLITPYVFAGSDGSFLTRDVVGGIPIEIARATDTRVITPNGYRHTYLSMLADSGLPLAVQRRLAGHREHSNVIARYTHDMRGDDVDTTPYLGDVVEIGGSK